LTDSAALPLRLGRYALYDEIASGGMATVHLGRLVGPVGFARTVAIKRLHPQHAKDPEFVAMFLDEARLAARIRHPNVVATLDVVATTGEVFLVMEYVEGESLASLLGAVARQQTRMPLKFAAHAVVGALHGLHAAHEAKDEHGEGLKLVHRDVSPHNILVGVDGVPRVLDFGVAKAAGRLQTTDEGRIKGKMAYMAPEQLSATGVSPRTDVFAASIVLWEALTGRRLFRGADPAEIVGRVLNAPIEAPSKVAPDVPRAIDEIVLKGLERNAAKRWTSALEMATALEQAAGLVPAREVGDWVRSVGATRLVERADRVAQIEKSSRELEAHPVSAREVMQSMATLEAPASGPVSATSSTGIGGTGRSQVASVLDARASLAPRTPVRRFLPLVLGAATVLGVLAVAVVALKLGKGGDASALPAATSAAAPEVSAKPVAAAVEPEPEPKVEPTPSASVEPQSGDAGAAPSEKPAAKPVVKRAVAAPKPAAKPVKPAKKGDSLYSRD